MSGRPTPILISTIAARDGGVPAMLRFAICALRRNGWDPHLAYYKPYSQSPELSVPLNALGRRKVASQAESGLCDTQATAIGAWFPELEFTHYQPRKHWRQLIDRFPAHLVISGTAIAGIGLARLGRRFVAWLATDLDGDRRDRVCRFPWYRRALDRGINARVLRAYEREVLRASHPLALSRHTERELNRVAGATVVRAVLPSPVDTVHFNPSAGSTVPRRIGFSGRLDDPRKNLSLLLDAMNQIASTDSDSELHLIGHRTGSPVEEWLAQRGLGGRVKLLPYVASDELPRLLAQLDVFVVPSHQEGLCISALEAMACGVPVVSTRCGGPEDFVANDQNGMLVDSDAQALASAIAAITADRPRRERLAMGARRTVETSYSVDRAESVLIQAMNENYPTLTRKLCA